MGNANESDAASSAEITPATPASAAANDAPLPVDAPKIEASAEPLRMERPRSDETIERPQPFFPPSVAQAESETAPSRRFGLLAASIAIAALLGAIAGAAATALTREPAPPATDTIYVHETQALKEAVARLGNELATLKAGMEVATKSTSSQLTKLSERFEKSEKAQAEPAAKLAKIADALDRMERRPTTLVAADTTGSIATMDKIQSKPPVIEGWRLRDYHAGRAILEHRAGAIYDIAPGSSLPGLGRVETIRREDGHIIIVTPKGLIVAAFDHRRPPNYRRF
jgi:hypothetical protein